MIIKVGPNGEVELEQLFTKQFIKKIGSYSIDKSATSIRIQFYDLRGNEIPAKLRKRGQSKKTP